MIGGMTGILGPVRAWLVRARATAGAGVLSRPADARGWSWRRQRAVTAVMLHGGRVQAVRLDTDSADRPARVTAAISGGADALGRLRKLAAGSTPVLVLGTGDRQLQVLDRPPVDDAELAMAVRWPTATALDIEPDELLCAPLPLPLMSRSGRPQVLVVSSPLATVRTQLDQLRAHRLDIRHVDTLDSALPGLLRLARADGSARVALLSACGSLCIALMWEGRLCAMRTLALPAGHPRQDDDYRDTLSLHIQRSVDSFERQATQLSLSEVVLSLPSLQPATREALAASLPLPSRLFDLAHHVEQEAAAAETLAAHEDLQSLCGVAAARLLGLPAPEPAAAPDAPARGPEPPERRGPHDERTPTPAAPAADPPVGGAVPSRLPASRQPADAAEPWSLLS
jgi:hypothetical protein